MLRNLTLLCCCLSSFSYGQSLQAVRSPQGVEITESGKKVLFYQQQPKSQAGKFTRASYVHPLYDLKGNEITEDFPVDHPHHRGVFWAWHQIIINGKETADGWSCENISWLPGKMSIKKKSKTIAIRSEVLWQSTSIPGLPEPIIKENTTIIVHTGAQNYRLIDFNIHLLPLKDNMQIGGSKDVKGYSGFSIRLKLPRDIQFISDGKVIEAQETAVAGAPWMDFRGSFDGEGNPVTGVTLFCDAGSAASPVPWILRKEESMQNVAYPGTIPVDLPRKGLTLKYRLVIHDDTLTEEAIRNLYAQYRE
ncbi:MAG: DUF6807 family protein [Flavitalea sp.]